MKPAFHESKQSDIRNQKTTQATCLCKEIDVFNNWFLGWPLCETSHGGLFYF